MYMGVWIFGRQKAPRPIAEVEAEVNAQTDQCTGVPDWFADCCKEHDIDYRTKRVSRREADRKLRQCIQSKSYLGVLSPVSWVRWTGVRVIGWLFD